MTPARVVAALKAMVALYDGLRDVVTSPAILAKLAEADAAIAEAEQGGVFPAWQGAKITRFAFDYVYGVRSATVQEDGRALRLSVSDTFEAAEITPHVIQ